MRMGRGRDPGYRYSTSLKGETVAPNLKYLVYTAMLTAAAVEFRTWSARS